jgi:acyl carrier protein
MALSKESLVKFLEDDLDLEMDGIEDDTPFISTSLIDSFSMIEMIGFIEKEAGIRIGATEVNLDNLDTIGRILAFVAKK